MPEKDYENPPIEASEDSSAMSVSEPKKGGLQIASADKGWKWTKKKRKAVQLIAKGWTYRRIGDTLSLNERTIRRWRKVPEFHAAILDKVREYMDIKRFKRTHETGVIADQLSTLCAQRLKSIMEEGGNANQTELNQIQLYLREYREFKNSEKVDFGDDPRGGGGVNVNIGIGVGGGAAPLAAGSQDFKAFVEEHMDKVPERIIAGANTPQEALLGISEVLIEETDLLDELYEEDKVIAAAEEAMKK